MSKRRDSRNIARTSKHTPFGGESEEAQEPYNRSRKPNRDRESKNREKQNGIETVK